MKTYEEKPFVCIAGKNDIAVGVLEDMVRRHSDCKTAVICNRSETGKNGFQKSLRWFAIKYGIAEYKLEDVYDLDNLVFLSLEFDRIIRPEYFKSSRLFNVHFSLLPKYKGMYTSAIPILNGERETGVTLHRIDAGIDTGEIIDQNRFSIVDKDCREVYLECIRRGTRLMLKHIDRILNQTEQSFPQDSGTSTYYSRKSLSFSAIEIDMNQTAEGIARQLRAYSFREYQLPEVYGRRIIDYAVTANRSSERPGSVLLKTGEAFVAATVDYNIVLFYDRLTELLEACQTGNLDIVRQICMVKKHVNAASKQGWTPLMTAVRYHQTKVAEYLLIHGADIHAVSHDGTTMLMYAKRSMEKTGDSAIFSMLLRLGADTRIQDYSGKTLKDYCSGTEIMKEDGV